MDIVKDFEKIKQFVENKGQGIVFGLGGMGDFLIHLDVCSKTNLTLLFWINKSPIYEYCKQLADFFGIDYYIYDCDEKLGYSDAEFLLEDVNKKILNGRVLSCYNNMHFEFPKIDFKPIYKNNAFKNLEKHKIETPKNYFIICPQGSRYHPSEKRLFYPDEFNKLIDFSVSKGLTPIIVGDDRQINFFDQRQKCLQLQFNKFNNEKISIGSFLYLIENSQFVISVDTFLKTLSGSMHKKTFVLKNRNEHDHFHDYGVGRWDHVFLNPEIWETIRMCSYEEIINEINKYIVIEKTKKLKML